MKTTREKRLDNIYSSNINEGFYTNAGGNFEVELVKKLLIRVVNASMQRSLILLQV